MSKHSIFQGRIFMSKQQYMSNPFLQLNEQFQNITQQFLFHAANLDTNTLLLNHSHHISFFHIIHQQNIEITKPFSMYICGIFQKRFQLILRSYLSVFGQANQQQMKNTALPKGLGSMLMHKLLLNGKKCQERHPNILSNNLFSKSWRKHIHSNLKTRQIDIKNIPDEKHAILKWFKNLSNKQKLEVTAITNKEFILSLLQNTQLECKGAKYCYEYGLSINLGTQLQQNGYFDKILSSLNFACLEDPVIYFQSLEFIQEIFMKWLEFVSKDKVFQDNRMGVEKGTNLLWFSRYSFHSFQQILCHEFELAIIKNYYSKTKTQIQLFQFKIYLKENHKEQCLKALNISLREILQDECLYRIDYVQLTTVQMQKFMQEKQMKMFEQLLREPEIKSKTKKEGKKKKKEIKQIKILKNNFSSQFALKEFEQYANYTQKGFKQTLATQQQLTANENSAPIKSTNIHLSEEKADKNDVKICEKLNRVSKIAHSSRQDQLNLSFEDSYHGSLSKNFIEITPKKTFSPENLRSSLTMSTQFLDYLNFSEKKRNQGKQEKEENKKMITKRSKKRQKKEKEAVINAHKIIYNRLISREIENTTKQILSQSNKQHTFKELIFERVKIFIKSLFPYCEVILFGSFSIGLSLANSDLDIQLINIPCNDKIDAGRILSYIQTQMIKMKWVTYSQAHIHAKVPVLKIGARPEVSFLQGKNNADIGFQIFDSKLISALNKIPNYLGQDINVDITILVNGVTSIGLQTTSFVKDYIHQYPQMKNCYLISKYILVESDCSSNYRGGIGSFYLFIMVAAYFKEYYHQNNTQSQIIPLIFELLSGNFTSKLIQLKDKEPCFIQHIQEKSQESVSSIQLRNPLNDEIMISKCYKKEQIKQQFSRICQILYQWSNKIYQQLQKDLKNIPQLLKNLQNKRNIDRYLRNLEQNGRFNLKQSIDSSKIIIS